MTTNPAWPDGRPVGAVRFARRTNNLRACVSFYRDLVGLPLLLEFGADGPDASAGAVFGMPGAAVTFELVESASPVAVDLHEQLVLYLPGPQQRDAAARRLQSAGWCPARSTGTGRTTTP